MHIIKTGLKTSQPNASLRLSPPEMPFTFFSGNPIFVFSHFFKFSLNELAISS
jgi:hypothetical protein